MGLTARRMKKPEPRDVITERDGLRLGDVVRCSGRRGRYRVTEHLTASAASEPMVRVYGGASGRGAFHVFYRDRLTLDRKATRAAQG